MKNTHDLSTLPSYSNKDGQPGLSRSSSWIKCAQSNLEVAFGNIQKTFREIVATIKAESPAIYNLNIAMVVLAVVCLFGLIVDDRTLMGVNVWLKPLKFALSTIIFISTTGFLMSIYPYSKRKKSIIDKTVAWSLFFELAIIAGQAARGVRSHYNVDTPLDGILFMLMGIFVGINVLIIVLFIFDTIRLKLTTAKSIQWAILLGWCVVFFGSWVGGQMIAQIGHNVGVADGGAGLPLVNWSTIGGDLRIAHFFGLHGIQLIPLFAFIIYKKWKTTTRNQIIAVTLFALLYASWIGFVFYQAKQGLALIAM